MIAHIGGGGGSGKFMSGICYWFAAIHWGKVADWAVAVGTLALAGATLRVASAAVKTLEENRRLVDETHNLVESNNKIIESEERRHQENLRPICIFELNSFSYGKVIHTPHQNVSHIDGRIFNKGRGIAIEGDVYFVLPTLRSYLVIKFQAIGHDELWHKTVTESYLNGYRKIENVSVPVLWCNEECAQKFIQAFENRDVVIFIRYRDIFGNYYITEQKMRSDTGQFDIALREDGAIPLDGLSCANNPKISQ